jgi:hypothetical protein
MDYYIKRLGNIPAKIQKYLSKMILQGLNIPGDTDPGALHMRSGSTWSVSVNFRTFSTSYNSR